MIYIIPIKQITSGVFHVKTKDKTCLEHLKEVLNHEETRDRVNLCLFHTFMEQDESYACHLDEFIQAMRSNEIFFFGVPVENYEKWVRRLTEEDRGEGVVLSVKTTDVSSVCFSVDPISLVVCSGLSLNHP